MPASFFKRLAGFSMAFEPKNLIEPSLQGFWSYVNCIEIKLGFISYPNN
jgi:hypothetical protein